MPKPRRTKGALIALCLLTFGGSGAALAEQGHEARSGRYLTVCADPNSLPFSNDRGEGFENRIAELIAQDLGRPIHYRWWPQTIGFVRNTLRTRLCDLITGISSVSELVQNTNPYYRSVYSLVYRADSNLKLKTLTAGDPTLSGLRIGVVAGTPPVTLLTRLGLLDHMHSYERTVDTRLYAPARDAVRDVARGETDLAIIWGPIAGYYAERQETPLTLMPLPAQIDGVTMAFNVSMGIRHRETTWKHQINQTLDHLQPQIQEILLSYGVPLLDQSDRPIQAD
ncbi:quinoprotein dehydrogenase-associated ABC transporter substrate-binding protein [Thiorhodococcus drewsii AZ1]|uniref:Quinoprotein dehydrogenase-associated ABC transporter substrate-binding protein n=1 Tax=Thiorhodococcus drewsii AZ1 TaxID=765913 RepID=G2DWW2_9GAMM|nr:quinoprotein dehydrogenase-associated putative ABC transporter substrate-binding protein [Thiorhodococcus drewsii]EGV33316.1 quinoprotein dehydrogenase-associated ABC transporter substrate-binding protein [Thiorhodococcus drewsii AZ1]